MTLTTRVNGCGIIVGCYEKVTLYHDGGRVHAILKLAQHKGVWRFGLDVQFQWSGFGSAPGIKDQAYLTRAEAIEAGKENILKWIGNYDPVALGKGAEGVVAACRQRGLFS